ncbi:MAG TPA: glycosyltransferase [Solirubrobacterales bacterium]|nr:glycosyltransferase [Solirubrobacterales bacterium]
MRICLVSSESGREGGIGHSYRRLASLLASQHEVTLIQSGGLDGSGSTVPDSSVREVSLEPSSQLTRSVLCNDDHRRSAAVLEAIERAYGSAGPDYVQVPDYRAHGLVPLQARRCGHPLLRETTFGVQICSSAELISLHDRTIAQPGSRLLADIEREQLRLADRIVWRGGDALDLYRRYYPFPLPEAARIRAPYTRPAVAPSPPRRDPGEPLRILYAGRLQRAKGALDLAEACLRLPEDGWQLTMIGDDTPTAPTGQSVQMTIEEMFGDDPRLALEDALPYEDLQRRWPAYDLLVVPSGFEVWSNVTIEAMRAGLPVLATPVGGPSEQVEPGVTGWHTDGIGPEALRRGLRTLLDDREAVEAVRASGAIFERFLRLTDPDEILEGYRRLLSSTRSPAKKRGSPPAEPLVTGVIPYYRTAPYVEEAVRSLLAQTHRNLDVVIVDDGSFEAGDEVLLRLGADPRVRVVTQLNGGESSARNLGVCLARGEYVAMLDSDNMLEPEFVARAIEVFRREPDLAYVSCWLRFVAADGSPFSDPAGYAPMGNQVVRDDAENWDGDTVAVLPRRLFSELGYRFEPASGIQSDWELYRWLREDGRFGVVIPDWLVRYRHLDESLMRAHGEGIHVRSWEEALARRLLRPTRWTSNA